MRGRVAPQDETGEASSFRGLIMIYSRRHLLLLAGASALLAKKGLCCNRGDSFLNRRIGLSFEKEPDWKYVSASDFQAGAAKQILSSSDDESIVHLARNLSGLPSAIAQAPNLDPDAFAAYVSVWSEPLSGLIDEDEDSPSDAGRLLEEAIEGWGLMLDELSIREAPAQDCNDPTQSVAEWEFLFRVEDNRSWRLRLSTILVVNPPNLITVHFGRDRDRPGDAEPLQRIRETLHVFAPSPPHSPNAYSAERVRT